MIDVAVVWKSLPMETMGERLRFARKAAGFNSARSAAERFGWTPSTYAAHENGQNGYDPETAKAYAKAFKVRFGAGWLLSGAVSTEINESIPKASDALNIEQTDNLRIEGLDRTLLRRLADLAVNFAVVGTGMTLTAGKREKDEWAELALQSFLALQEIDALQEGPRQTPHEAGARKSEPEEGRAQAPRAP